MTRTTIRSIAAAMAVAVTAGVLQSIAILAHVDSPSLPVVALPAVEVIAHRPGNDEPVFANSSTDADL
ncbi:MAG TPA: hypothetical protein VLW55_09240 [Burkholderiaceae bacterium]|nr:hypothetical protein [Burkholderiaceae bacterium]